MTKPALAKWYDYMKSHDLTALRELLHEDAVFESPVVHTPQRGRDITFKYLASAEKVLGGPGFKYVGEWHSANGAVLEFENQIEGITINGVDIITLQRRRRADHALQGDGAAAQGDQPAASADGRATGESVSAGTIPVARCRVQLAGPRKAREAGNDLKAGGLSS